MIQDLILSYYKKLVVSSSVFILTTSLGFVTFVFFLVVLFFGFQATQVNDQNKLVLANQNISSLVNTFSMIGNSSHSIIALKYGDYAGYRRVVLPWIQGDPRILGMSLKDNAGEVKVQWNKDGQEFISSEAEGARDLLLVGSSLFYTLDITDAGQRLGSITFYTNLKVTGLDGLDVRENSKSSSCKTLESLPSAEICSSSVDFSRVALVVIAYIFICSIIVILSLKTLISKLGNRLQAPIQALHQGLSEIQKGNAVEWSQILPEDSQSIFMPLGSHISKAATDYQELKGRIVIADKLSDLAKQVSHDIRSPLSALSMVMSTLKDLPEDKRILIRQASKRINDIANGLLEKAKSERGEVVLASQNNSAANTAVANNIAIEFVPAIVDMIVSEKRMQFREHSNVEIDIDLRDSFGAFSRVDSYQLKRVISNLVNNAVESIEHRRGIVLVTVRNFVEQNQVEISVCDNGKGMNKSIIEKLGQQPISFGKSNFEGSGNGLGLYHARAVVESLGGQLSIESTVAVGTVVKMLLPLAETPSWFANAIELNNKKYIVVLDDDESIHQIWSGRISRLADAGCELISFRSAEVFSRYVLSNLNQLSSTIFLVDYELLNQAKTGLDLIEEFALEKHSILVTSHYEEPSLRARAAKIGLRILPKSLAGFVPFKVSKKNDFDDLLQK